MADASTPVAPAQDAEIAAGGARGWRAWFARSDPTVLAEQLSVSYGNYTFNSAVALFIVLYLYFSAGRYLESWLIDAWVALFCPYLALRMASGLVYPHRKKLSEVALRRWDRLLLISQGYYGIMLVVLALTIFPILDAFAQSLVLTGALVLLGSTAFSFSGHVKAMALSAPAVYLAFAWSAWHQPGPYSGGLTALILSLLGLYIIYALKHRRSLQRGFALAIKIQQMASELQVKNDQLQEVAAARGRLLANVSHDLRQPAHAIGLLTERALLDPAGAPVRPILTDLQQLSQSLSASLSTLMDLTRLDAGLTQARMESIALNPLLQRLRLEYALMAQSKELDLSVSDTTVWVHSDPVLLHAVLANLLGNALKYTRRGQVTVEVIESGEEICVTVSDTGAGIESSQLNTIFKEFVRLDASKPGTEGLGLGLSIVQRYAALLGHRIDVHSEPGRGSRFGVSMQRVHVQAQTVSLLPLPDDQRLVGLRVLLVDNVPLLVTSLARTLAALGCQISTAESLDQALALEDLDRIEMVISDFHLGDREPDGLAVIDAMRSRRGRQSPLAALIITGDVSAELESRAAAAGVRIQHKPVRPQTLQRCMIEMLQGR